MPEQRGTNAYERAEFEVVFKGETMEPGADVAPEGEVTFVLLNDDDVPHDFALMSLAPGAEAWERSGEPVGEDDLALVGMVRGIEPGAEETLTYPLVRGRYVLIANTSGKYAGSSLFTITVQPAEMPGG